MTSAPASDPTERITALETQLAAYEAAYPDALEVLE